MTKRSDIPKLFNFDPETPRIVGFGIGAWISYDTESPDGPIAVTTNLADPKTKMRSENQLLIALNQVDAMSLARTILSHAAKCGWQEPEGGQIIEAQPLPKNKLH